MNKIKIKIGGFILGVRIFLSLFFMSIFLYSNENIIEYIKGNVEIKMSKDRDYEDEILIDGLEKELIDGARLYINNEGIATILKRKINDNRALNMFERKSFNMVDYEIKSILLDKQQFQNIKKNKYTDNIIVNDFEVSYLKINKKGYRIDGAQKEEMDGIIKAIQEKKIKNIYLGNINGNVVVINDEMIVTILENDENYYIKFVSDLKIIPENSVFPYKIYDFDNKNETLIKVFLETVDSFINKEMLEYINKNEIEYIVFKSENCGSIMKVTGQFNQCEILGEEKIKSPKTAFKLREYEFLKIKELLSENKTNELENYILELPKNSIRR